MTETPTNLIIGAGPAGLAAGYELTRSGQPVLILEADSEYLGGLSRTYRYKGYRFDLGGHRFFTKSPEVEQFWHAILGSEMRRCHRLSRIYFGGRFFKYPLDLRDVLTNLGLVNSALCVGSYLRAHCFPRRPVESFEDWIVNNFGTRLFETFFKTYTEKVWGIPCDQISADWAAQRIKGLNIISICKEFLRGKPNGNGTDRSRVIKTLTNEFDYPRLGPGQLWEEVAARIERQGGRVLMGRHVQKLHVHDRSVTAVTASTAHGKLETFPVKNVISTMPMSTLVQALTPEAPEAVLRASRSLTYRDFLIVVLALKETRLFDDQWIYIHDPSVKVGRIQNYKNWSPDLVPDPACTSLGLEYFTSSDSAFWNQPDEALLQLAEAELAQLKFAKPGTVIDGRVVRMPHAYPAYGCGYSQHITTIRNFLEAQFENVQVAGRNGMHRYNNQDHAIMTGFVTARNILAQKKVLDPWRVNQDALYLEETSLLSEDLPEARLSPQALGQ